jgi:hypothetical protein
MPYLIIPLKNDKYMVINKLSGKIHSKLTTLDKAEKQIRLMRYIDSNKTK